MSSLPQSDPDHTEGIPAKIPRARRTKYMMEVERNKIREMLLSGLTETEIAHKRNLKRRQIQNYVRDIRLEDYRSLMAEDETARASAIESAKLSLTRLKAQMLLIAFGDNIPNPERIAAAEMARQFELDLVNLKLNGPHAINLRYANPRQLKEEKRLSPRERSSEPDTHTIEPGKDDRATTSGDPIVTD